MMRKLEKFGEHMLWALVLLASMLIVLWFILNILATKTPAPISTGAHTVGTLASGSTYGF